MNNEPLAFNANKGKPPMPSDGKKGELLFFIRFQNYFILIVNNSM
jgi:hypothetical protein